MNNMAPDGFSSVTLGTVVATPGPLTIPSGLAPETIEIMRNVRAQEAKNANLRRWQRVERTILLPILVLVTFCLFNFKMGIVQGRSMAPTYATGDHILMLKSYAVFSPLKVGDIVVVKLHHGAYSGEQWVKRVVYIQNKAGNAPWQNEIHTPAGKVTLDYWFADYARFGKQVPLNHILVMGDNYMNSTDSRDEEIGPIATDEIEGKVIKFWPSQNNIESAAL